MLRPTNMEKWKMASWKTVFLYKPVVFHFHDCFRETYASFCLKKTSLWAQKCSVAKALGTTVAHGR